MKINRPAASFSVRQEYPWSEGRSSLAFPDVHIGVPVAFPAECHGVSVAAPVAPDIEGSAFFAERPAASIADDHGIVLSADLADPAFDDFYHGFSFACRGGKIKS
jgi:hypothetical protein